MQKIRAIKTQIFCSGFLVNVVILPNDWRIPIIEYSENPRHDADRKLKYKALKFVMQGGLLYRRFVDGTLGKCLGGADACLALSEVHEGICGAYQVGEKKNEIGALTL